MRTKTVLLSALLGAIGTVSVMAQTNVYSLNAVGYINVTVQPGFNMISCPLVASPSNTIGNLLINTGNQLRQCEVYQWNPSTSTYTNDEASTSLATGNGFTNGWEEGGFIPMNPGQALWFQNVHATNITFTFVGTVPTGSLTNTIVNGFNQVSSILPMSGDLVTNSLSMFTNATKQDSIYFWDPVGVTYDIYSWSKANGWTSNSIATDPPVPFVGSGFWYETANGGITWVENYAVQ